MLLHHNGDPGGRALRVRPAEPVNVFTDNSPLARTERKVPCGASARFTALLDERSARLRTDTYHWVVTASQSNGRTTAEDRVTGSQQKPWGQPLRRHVSATGAGAPDALRLTPRLVDRNGQVLARVRINCEAGRSLNLSVVLAQVANRSTISGASLTVPHTCNGDEVVAIPVRARNGLLWAGAATATVTTNITCQPGAPLWEPRLWVSYREGRAAKTQHHFSSQRGNALLLDLACNGEPELRRVPLFPDLMAPSTVVRMSFDDEPPQEARLTLTQE